jgi:hypothetical protein
MLQTWFRWRSNNTTHKKATSVVLSGAVPRMRQLRDTEVYSKLFYESKLKGLVDGETEGSTFTSAERFHKVMEVMKREWALESDAVKAQVQAMKEELQKERDSKANGDSEPTPKQRQAAIDNLNHVASTFLLHIKRTTGWTGFVVLGGPKLNAGTDVAVAS